MSDLDLPEEIIVSRLAGESPEGAVDALQHVLTVIKDRNLELAGSGLRRWSGPKTVVVIAPSSEVFAGDYRTVELAQVIARLGRAAGVTLRLIDVHPALRKADKNGPAVYSLAACGSRVLCEFASAPEVDAVIYCHVSPREMEELAENGGRS